MIDKYFNDRHISTPTQYNLAYLAKSQAVEFLQARIAKHEAMSDEESEVRAADWEIFKQNIDAENEIKIAKSWASYRWNSRRD